MADTNEATQQTILLAEDDEVFRSRLARALGQRGLLVTEADTGRAAIDEAERESPELALVDLRLPDIRGLEVVRALREVDPATRIVVLTGYGSIATALEAVRLGAVHYLTKPATTEEILAAFEREAAADADAEPAYQPPSLARVEWEHINRVLADCGGNITRAAKVLGLHRRTLQRKLEKYPPRD